MSAHQPSTSPVRTSPIRLETFRCPDDEPVIVRTLSESYLGLFTHYAKPSAYCPGAKCTCSKSRLQRIWKGYFPAERWVEKQGYWLPCCFELTENAELFMRSVFDRGQQWLLRRVKRQDRKHPSIEATMTGTFDQATLPFPFDITPCLQRLYHFADIEARWPNPMPAHTIVQPSVEQLPAHVLDKRRQEEASKSKPIGDYAEVMNRMKSLGTSPEIHNGKH